MNPDDSTKNSISRRKLLAATGGLGITSLAGCLNPNAEGSVFSDSKPTRINPSKSIENVTIKLAPTQRSNPYFVAISDDIISSSSIFNGQQIRIQLQNNIEGEFEDPYLFTANTNPAYTSERDKTIWVSRKGMERLDVVENTLMEIFPYSSSPRFETRQEGRENNELIGQYVKDSQNILFIAPYGGDIYQNTGFQAIRGSSQAGFSSWILLAYGNTRKSAIDRWYNPPELYTPKSFYGLQIVNRPFQRVVSFSGFDGSGKEVVIGGLASDELKKSIKHNLDVIFGNTNQSSSGSSERDTDHIITQQSNVDISIRIAYSGDLAEMQPQHIANNLSEKSTGGITINQTQDVLHNHWKLVSDAVIAAVEDYEDQSF